MNSAAATAWTLYAIATTDPTPCLKSPVATVASNSLLTAPEWQALRTTIGTSAEAIDSANLAAETASEPPSAFSNTSIPNFPRASVGVRPAYGIGGYGARDP